MGGRHRGAGVADAPRYATLNSLGLPGKSAQPSRTPIATRRTPMGQRRARRPCSRGRRARSGSGMALAPAMLRCRRRIRRWLTRLPLFVLPSEVRWTNRWRRPAKVLGRRRRRSAAACPRTGGLRWFGRHYFNRAYEDCAGHGDDERPANWSGKERQSAVGNGRGNHRWLSRSESSTWWSPLSVVCQSPSSSSGGSSIAVSSRIVLESHSLAKGVMTRVPSAATPIRIT